MKAALLIEVEVDADSAAERALTEWLRTWRRRGVRPSAQRRDLHQGAVLIFSFRAPAQAAAELDARLAGRGAKIRRLPEKAPR